ncbi:uncharacterized protein [Halyomorpha halys]|uniref:uncharacterized protein n=1 Tax=Halyomorpha halys TaxID=286706 RepID=UPI0034D24C70
MDGAVNNRGLMNGGGNSELGVKEVSLSQPNPANYSSPSSDVTNSSVQCCATSYSACNRESLEHYSDRCFKYKDIIEVNSRIILELQEFLLTGQAKQISKTAVEAVLIAARKLEDNCNTLIVENAELKGEITPIKDQHRNPIQLDTQALKLVIKDVVKEQIKPLVVEKEDTIKKRTYASAIVHKHQETTKKPLSSVFIAQTDQSKEKYPTIQALKQGIKENFTPATEGVKIRGVVETAKGVIIRTRTKEEARKVIQSEGIKRLGGNVNFENKRLPRMIIYDVLRDLDHNKIIEHFWSLNANKLERTRQHFNPVFKTGPRGRDSVHWVVEVSPGVRHEILAEGRVFLEWAYCNVRDWVAVSRCNNCQGLSHIEKFCTEAVVNCRYCGERDHSCESCPKQKSGGPPKCINCSRINTVSDHSSDYKECPTYKRSLERTIMRTQYEDKE